MSWCKGLLSGFSQRFHHLPNVPAAKVIDKVAPDESVTSSVAAPPLPHPHHLKQQSKQAAET